MLTYLGSLTLAVAVPLLGLMDLALGPLIAELQAKLAAMIKLSVAVTITLPAVTAAAMLAAAAKLALYPPAIGATATLALAASAKLALQIEALLLLPKWNATAGVHSFVYEGPASGLGAALNGAHVTMGVAPGQDTYAVILIGTAGATQTALKAVFKTP